MQTDIHAPTYNKNHSGKNIDHNKHLPKTSVPFWTENPNVLFQQQYITEFFPTEEMGYAQKLNAISRLIIYITVGVFLVSRNIRSLIISALTLFAIYLVYSSEKKKHPRPEGFGSAGPDDSGDFSLSDLTIPGETADGSFNSENASGNLSLDSLAKQSVKPPKNMFQSPAVENPFSNVLVSDYDYNVNKKPAPPVYAKSVGENVLSQAKQLVRDMNGDQPEIADKLFRDLGEQFVFEQSLRPFYSTANTTIPNDQKGFAEFCYGSMISCKEGNQFACARNLSRHTN
jgi:hypothetical protein